MGCQIIRGKAYKPILGFFAYIELIKGSPKAKVLWWQPKNPIILNSGYFFKNIPKKYHDETIRDIIKMKLIVTTISISVIL